MSAAGDAEATAPSPDPRPDSAPHEEPPSLVGWSAAIAPFLAGAFAVAVYATTAAPGAWWGDGLELTAAAKVLGIPHPPGYPLYTLLGHLLLTAVSGIDPGRAMTLFSALMCGVSAALTGSAALRLLFEPPSVEEGQARQAVFSRGAAALLALGLTLLVAFTRTLWEHGTFAEVYPLSLALVCAMVLVAGWPSLPGESPGHGRVLLIALLAGLSALNHYSAAAAGPLVLFSVIAWGRKRGRAGASVALLFVVFAICFCGYLWLPLRAASNPPLNFGNPDSLRGLLWMLTGGQYTQIQALQGGGALHRLSLGAGTWFRWWGGQFISSENVFLISALSLIILFPAVAGLLHLSLRSRALGLGLLAMLASTLIFGMIYRIPDIDAYFLPGLPAAVLGWAELIRIFVLRYAPPRWRSMAAATCGILLISLALIVLQTHAHEMDKSWDRGPEVWAANVLDALPAGAVVLTRQGSDAEIYALWYAQIVEGKRPDVTVFGTGFIFSGWYGSYFKSAGRPEVPVFVTDRAPGSKADYDIALIGGVIVPNLKKRRVFLTYRDPVIEEYFSPRPTAELLPAEYYEQTQYTLNAPGSRLYELTRNLQFEPLAEARFREMYGLGQPL